MPLLFLLILTDFGFWSTPSQARVEHERTRRVGTDIVHLARSCPSPLRFWGISLDIIRGEGRTLSMIILAPNLYSLALVPRARMCPVSAQSRPLSFQTFTLKPCRRSHSFIPFLRHSPSSLLLLGFTSFILLFAEFWCVRLPFHSLTLVSHRHYC